MTGHWSIAIVLLYVPQFTGLSPVFRDRRAVEKEVRFLYIPRTRIIVNNPRKNCLFPVWIINYSFIFASVKHVGIVTHTCNIIVFYNI